MTIRQLYVVTIRPGATRADHFHKKKTEWLCALRGACTLELTDVATRERNVVELRADAWTVWKIPPGTHHLLRNAGSEELVLIVGADREHTPEEPDVFRLPGL